MTVTCRGAAALLACAIAWQVSPVLARAPVDGVVRVALGDRLRVPVPVDMSWEQRSLGPLADMLILTEGGDVMVVTAYRPGAAGRAPTPAEALQGHVEALAQVFGPGVRRPLKVRLLGRDQPALALVGTKAGVEREGWVVAAEAQGRTVVAVLAVAAGSPNRASMFSIMQGIRSK